MAARKGFWTHVAKEPGESCWLWTGSVNQFGYGKLFSRGRSWKAHRFSYTQEFGEIPDGLVVHHLCDQRLCVRPDHLKAVTNRGNLFADGSLCRTKANAEKTHCPKGHRYDADNTRIRLCRNRLGKVVAVGRECRACARERKRSARAERRAA